jgi:hypothetical protein
MVFLSALAPDRSTADPSALTLAIAHAKADAVLPKIAADASAEPAIVITSGLLVRKLV